MYVPISFFRLKICQYTFAGLYGIPISMEYVSTMMRNASVRIRRTPAVFSNKTSREPIYQYAIKVPMVKINPMNTLIRAFQTFFWRLYHHIIRRRYFLNSKQISVFISCINIFSYTNYKNF